MIDVLPLLINETNKKMNIYSKTILGAVSISILYLLITSFTFKYDPVISELTTHLSADSECERGNNTFVSGEKIVYKAYYNWGVIWIPAGEATFIFIENKNTYEVTVVGRTYSSYDALFRVRDYFHTKIDKTTMLPQQFVRIVEEGNYRKFDSISFNQNSGLATSFNGRTRAQAQRKTILASNCTHDLLSVLYFMRNINIDQYKVGDFIPTRILFDETIYPIKVRYDGSVKNHDIKDLGTFNTIKVVPDLVTGNVFKDGNKMSVYVSDDKNKLPLLIESPMSVGTAKAVLKSYTKLRYPLTAKVK